jgi:hypothetical protein
MNELTRFRKPAAVTAGISLLVVILAVVLDLSILAALAGVVLGVAAAVALGVTVAPHLDLANQDESGTGYAPYVPPEAAYGEYKDPNNPFS